jgi:hypothetical protein
MIEKAKTLELPSLYAGGARSDVDAAARGCRLLPVDVDPTPATPP